MNSFYSTLFFWLCLVSLFACGTKETNTQTNSGSSKTLVDVTVVKKEQVKETVDAIGNIIANESAQLAAEQSGRISKIYFDEGTKVNKGKLLLELNNADLKADLKEIESKLNLAKIQLDRTKELLKFEGVSQNQLDEAESKYAELNAQFLKTEAEINKTKVFAPFDGVIGLRKVSEGDNLNASSSFATIVDLENLKIEFAIAEKYLNQIKIGDTIQFTSASNSEIQQAKIYAINSTIDESSRKVALKALYKNSDGKLIPGGFANVRYVINISESSITIPNQAIVPELNGKKVFIVKNGVAQAKKVVSGIRMVDQIEILEGLNDGDTIITTGLLQVRDGMGVSTKMASKIQSGL
ncbi:MAG: efflux RND transporter periplasmic adaptor subunit [Flavobacteriales bacterium]|nr:efflux RND transporter periplasmic adaptor subunit [Flavobacteriales bacterium]